MKLSVRIITYNHEKYIAQAIDSVLMQKVNFDYEIVIGEDCSTDKTQEVVIEYQKRYPDKIRLLLSEKNLGARNNGNRALAACRSEYVAMLEGDDFWTSHQKLQKQVDFLDNHPECAICFHNIICLYENGSRDTRLYHASSLKEILTLEDLLVNNVIPTCSVMYRRDRVSELPPEFNKLKMGDWPRHILAARYGHIGYINEVMAAYRIHSDGIWTRGRALSNEDSTRTRLVADIEFYEVINEYLEYKYDPLIRSQLSKRCYSLAKKFRKQGNWAGMRKYLLKSFLAKPFTGDVSFNYLVKAFLISYFPAGYEYYRSNKRRIKP